MKKLLTLALFVLSLSACKKDSTNGGVAASKDQIVGNWIVQSYITDNIVNGQSQGAHDDHDPGDFLNFNANNTYTGRIESVNETGTWSVSGDQLTLNTGGNTGTLTIKAVTSNTLKLYGKNGPANDYDEATLNLVK